jgi:deoxyribodipyrimidine photo-lyase
MLPDLENPRLRCSERPIRPDGALVLYWMTSARRLRSNFALERAATWARRLRRPLLIFEPLRAAYEHASDRLHTFVLDGMHEHAHALAGGPVGYFPYVEPRPGDGHGLLEALAAHACVVVTDDYPVFFLPRMVEAASGRLPVRLEVVDTNGLMPMRATERVFTTAASFRRHLQKSLVEHLQRTPSPDPLAEPLVPFAGLPEEVRRRWPPCPGERLGRDRRWLAALPIDHAVSPVEIRGGARAAHERLGRFVDERLADYGRGRNDPARDGASGLSPYLHFGHLGAHEVFTRVVEHEDWSLATVLDAHPTGSREGWWNMREGAEAFLDQLITWRELGFNFASHRDDYAHYDSLPDWALRTLRDHAADPRPDPYTPEQLEAARTHDPIWNAAQVQLVREGKIHNYLRMLWGKKILEWSPTPRHALDVMITLNDRYALDGRDPNSYSGMLWCLGRYDRAWGPARPIFGKVRYMSSANTARKLNLRAYLRQHAT